MIDPKKMSQAQQDAVDKAYELLGEHFDCALIAVAWEIETDGEERTDGARIFYKGGFAAALGLAELAKHNLAHGDAEPVA